MGNEAQADRQVSAPSRAPRLPLAVQLRHNAPEAKPVPLFKGKRQTIPSVPAMSLVMK
jgi:hypothetical protein